MFDEDSLKDPRELSLVDPSKPSMGHINRGRLPSELAYLGTCIYAGVGLPIVVNSIPPGQRAIERILR
jgi:hypothetical protein